MSCHAILKNLYEPKMDVILTISFKITAEIEITKTCFAFYFHCHGICVCIVFLLLIDQLMQRDHLGGGRFIQKALNQRLFPEIT